MTDNTHKKVRLTFFSFGILEQGGGFEYFLMKTAKDLHDRYPDLEITIVTMSPKIVEKLQHILTIYFMRKQDPKAIYRESLESVRRMIGSVRYVRADSLKELAETLKASDVIYSKNEILEMSVLNRIGLKKLPPVVVGVHTPVYYTHTPSLSAKLHNALYTGLLYKKFIKRIAAIQVNNHDDLALVRDKLGFGNVKVMPQAFAVPDLKKITPSGKGLRILFAGRLTEAKGVDILLAVIKGLAKEQEAGDFTIRIAGSGDVTYVDAVKAIAEASPGVTYLGHVPQAEVPALYDWADVTIITSKYETLNKVAIETATAGKVTVCTDIPGPREVIRHGETGFLVPADPQAFITQLLELARWKQTEPAALVAIGQKAHAYIKEKYDAEQVYAKLHDEIVRVAKRG